MGIDPYVSDIHGVMNVFLSDVLYKQKARIGFYKATIYILRRFCIYHFKDCDYEVGGKMCIKILKSEVAKR